MGATMETTLVLEALNRALGQRHPYLTCSGRKFQQLGIAAIPRRDISSCGYSSRCLGGSLPTLAANF